MASIDFEAEFNARAAVPEHPQIFARWRSDAARYRATAPCRLGVAYGDGPRQAVDVFGPAGTFARAGTLREGPLALFIHGGWWRAMERESFSHMARGLNAHGVAVAVAGYDLCPQVTIGAIVDQMRAAAGMLAKGRRIVAFGHSAGGHLAAVLASTVPEAVAAGYAISGVFDLEPLIHTSMNADFGLDAATARALSPLHMPPAPFDSVVGGLESNAFKAQSRALSRRWGAAYGEAAGANHFTVLDALADPDSTMVARLRDMCVRYP
ncbi:MAG: alpha/beta hydrolase [Alphaproteobacteria bacterium]|nr:alpha/beta hydrolase [Alphaproteobacteria bacterium]